jgi:large conductance mechanosensitive channel
MIKEFKEFVSKGNVLDLAVGVVIGGAFGKIVSSLVDNIIMPLMSSLLGEKLFVELSFNLNGSEIMYGAFLQSVVDFLIISFVIFMFIKILNKFKKKEEKKIEKPVKSNEEKVLEEIRDLLKKK